MLVRLIFYLSQLILIVVPMITGLLGLVIERLFKQAFPTTGLSWICELFVILGMPVLFRSAGYIRLKPVLLVFFHLDRAGNYVIVNLISIGISVILGIFVTQALRRMNTANE